MVEYVEQLPLSQSEYICACHWLLRIVVVLIQFWQPMPMGNVKDMAVSDMIQS